MLSSPPSRQMVQQGSFAHTSVFVPTLLPVPPLTMRTHGKPFGGAGLAAGSGNSEPVSGNLTACATLRHRCFLCKSGGF